MNTETEEYIILNNSTVNSDYAISGYAGRSIFDFEISQVGEYKIEAWYESGEGEEIVLAIGKGMGKALITTILSSIGVMFITFALSLTIFLITLIKRKKNKEDLFLTV